LKNKKVNVFGTQCIYTVSQKTTLMLHTITSTHITDFGNFWQRCCWESTL